MVCMALQVMICSAMLPFAYGRDVTVAGASAGPQSIEQLDTSTTALIGTAPSGPVLQPTLVKSWDEYKAVFGDFDTKYYLSCAVYAFFQNGGKRAYIVRVAHSAAPAAPVLKPKTVNRNEYLAGMTKTIPMADYASALALLEKIENIHLVAIPGQTDLPTQTALIRHCEKMQYRFAILDSKYQAGDSGVPDQAARLKSAQGYAALYYPWINIKDPVTGSIVGIPPSGAIAGVFARSDIAYGIQQAPANLAVNGVVGLEKSVTQTEQGQLDLAGVNVIRLFPGRGYLVWGSKTLSPDALWKAVNVRRVCMNLEESIDLGIGWTVFEPYNETLWNRTASVIDNFLFQMWENRVLQGDRREKAYFVKCDRTTMTQSDIDNKRLICRIGIAVTGPSDFIIFNVMQQIQR